VLDSLTYAGNLASIADLIDGEETLFIHGDIRDAEVVDGVFAQHRIDRVVHLAAESHVDRSILGPRTFIETNVTGTLNLLLAAQEHWQERRDVRFLHVSTDEVYGALTATGAPFNERTSYAPNSPYAASKAAADHLVRAWHQTYGFPALLTNCSNNYGPWQFPEKLIPLSILNAMAGRELPVYGNGEQTRDWLHVRDHCEALCLVLERGVVGDTYCIGGDNQQLNIRVVERICDLVDSRLGRPVGTARALIRHVEDRPGHDQRYAIDATKLTRELGWKARFEFAPALADVVDWYLTHPEWIESTRNGDHLRFYELQYSRRLKP
jgi:dTDP-glucose 4,6-dehydratase